MEEAKLFVAVSGHQTFANVARNDHCTDILSKYLLDEAEEGCESLLFRAKMHVATGGNLVDFGLYIVLREVLGGWQASIIPYPSKRFTIHSQVNSTLIKSLELLIQPQ
jgi:hypothetical protein